ncbi:MULTISPECIES: hypothetical protein [Pasteurellaceae]|uniref:Uncharacterized protein n=1 Tax=Pasteurella atlantica TaxID=2827233 RepID=A0AAW8CPG8_9PAST|nr:hypothetical protein [Pasteurella atlantica]MBR0573861.1 hypothetical protein [Pasteurella atlantica]MDP8039253.1 hypothetical protein [Pasteurella atlantica]MDP8041344.1 hypothetical protein [Pasteurella atlantica]MDP8043480.1 hypothetical protein [Pasteurella atlantica]MDP8045601.1 hypothetical protein [Pasteurella atlantica]
MLRYLNDFNLDKFYDLGGLYLDRDRLEYFLKYSLKNKAQSEPSQQLQCSGQPRQERLSEANRVIFSLACYKVFGSEDLTGYSTNKIKDIINAELMKIGCKEVSYNTIDNLIKNNPSSIKFPAKK